MKTLFIAIDVGCHECGVDSEVLGSAWTKAEAELLVGQREATHKWWRDSGQSIPEVFEVEVPEPQP